MLFHQGRLAALALAASLTTTCALPRKGHHDTQTDPFAVLDPQEWENPDHMTWDDYIRPPGSNWYDPSRRGTERNFNIALIAVDYSDEPFVISLAANSTVFTNPQPAANSVPRSDVPSFYRDLLNNPQELNRNHTLHEYWMEDSGGKYGVDLTSFGPYRMPSLSYQYGIDDEEGGFNENACPAGPPCSVDLRTDALGAWRAAVGNTTANSFELVFILSAGHDESSTWQEFGEMLFDGPDGVTDAFGPPANSTLTNWAQTRYVDWTSWASASTIWPNAGRGSSTQGESSGMGTYAHELSHLLGIGDNYNNPYSVPRIRDYTGPFSMMSRGSFNGPGGPHTRWQIPSLQGGSLGSPHTSFDKMRIGLVDNATILTISRDTLAASGAVLIANLTARVVHPASGAGLMGVHIEMGTDLSPPCNQSTDPLCDGGGYNNYDLQVVDRMGADSFQPDSGVMLSKSKNEDRQPFEWMIDANPQDLGLLDFVRPNGSASYITVGDYRQLADALFHAGTRSGSKAEYVDEANKLHFYVLDAARDAQGVLHYVVGVRSLDSLNEKAGVRLSPGKVSKAYNATSAGFATTCTFDLKNSGKFSGQTAGNTTSYLQSDVYRLSVEVEGDGWQAVLPNEFAAAAFGRTTNVKVAVGTSSGAAKHGKVYLTATSESDPSKTARKMCKVNRASH